MAAVAVAVAAAAAAAGSVVVAAAEIWAKALSREPHSGESRLPSSAALVKMVLLVESPFFSQLLLASLTGPAFVVDWSTAQAFLVSLSSLLSLVSMLLLYLLLNPVIV